MADSDDWNFGTGDFTEEMWVRFDSVAARRGFSGQEVDGYNYRRFFYRQEDGVLQFESSSGSINVRSAWSPSINTWYHLAVTRASGVIRIFVDGVSQTLTTNSNPSADMGDLAAAFTVGVTVGVDYMSGWIDEVRISKGIARWTSNFTPHRLRTKQTPHRPP